VSALAGRTDPDPAVLSEPAPAALLAAVAGLDHQTTSAAVDELVAEHLLSVLTNGEISFRHVLVLDAVAEHVPLRERSRLHARAATALSALSAPPVVQLARHLKESGDSQGWARYAERVADLALGGADDFTAARILVELATATIQRPADLTRIVSKIPFPVFRSVDQYRFIEDILRSAAQDQTLSRLDQGRVRWQLARVLIMADQMSEAAEETERAVPLLGGEPLLAGQVMISLVHLSWPNWSPATRDEWLRRASSLLSDRDPASELRLVSDLATVLLRFGSAEGWTEAAKIPTRDVEVRDHPASRLGPELVMEASAILAELALAKGEPEQALAITEEPFSLIERTGVWLWGADLVPTHVRSLLLTRRLARARDVVGERWWPALPGPLPPLPRRRC